MRKFKTLKGQMLHAAAMLVLEAHEKGGSLYTCISILRAKGEAAKPLVGLDSLTPEQTELWQFETFDLMHAYDRMFRPDDFSGSAWGLLWLETDVQELAECRIMALLFASAMAEAGDL